MLSISLVLLTTYIFTGDSAPLDSNEVIILRNNETTYDVSQFDEVYDQRQNGSENFRVNLNKIVLVWAPPGSLLTAALLADPSLYDPEFGEIEDFLKPDSGEKPENMTTTSTETPPAASPPAESPKRRLRIPGFIRSFVRKQHPRQ